jgi:hypothetical protein
VRKRPTIGVERGGFAPGLGLPAMSRRRGRRVVADSACVFGRLVRCDRRCGVPPANRTARTLPAASTRRRARTPAHGPGASRPGTSGNRPGLNAPLHGSRTAQGCPPRARPSERAPSGRTASRGRRGGRRARARLTQEDELGFVMRDDRAKHPAETLKDGPHLFSARERLQQIVDHAAAPLPPRHGPPACLLTRTPRRSRRFPGGPRRAVSPN